MTALLITIALVLLPLVPSAVLYKILSPKPSATSHEDGTDHESKGDVVLPDWLGGGHITFKVAGSTAVYFLILIVTACVYAYFARLANEEAVLRAESMKDNKTWLVQIPVGLQDAAGNEMPDSNDATGGIMVETKPKAVTAYGKTLLFRVVRSNGMFPTADFTQKPFGLTSVELNLNDSNKVHYDYPSQTITSIEPVWIVVGGKYLDKAGLEGATALTPQRITKPNRSLAGDP